MKIKLDEPMNGLDSAGVEEIRKLLLDMKQSGKTILPASHNKEDIDQLCDEVYRIESGKLRKQEQQAENDLSAMSECVANLFH